MLKQLGFIYGDLDQNKTFEVWNPGKHYVRISWDTITGLPDFGEYEWEFTTY